MPVSVDDGILMTLREAGSSDAQIADAKLILGPLCHMDGGNCVLAATNAPLQSAESLAWLKANKPHLLPTDTADSDAAFIGTGNKTAAAKLIQKIGREAADRIAQTYGKAHALDNKPGISPQRGEQQRNSKTDDRKGNPWSAAGWSLTRHE